MDVTVISDKENRTQEVCGLISLKAKQKGINSQDSFENSFSGLCLEVANDLNLNFEIGENTFKEVYIK